MTEFELIINGHVHKVNVEGDMPLLWLLRDFLDLTGTKYGCGIGVCGACTVLIDNEAVRSCQMPVISCKGKKILTIEGVSVDGTHPVQKAWAEENVPQCGYCQAGQMMAFIGLLNETQQPTKQQVNDTMSQILCRCGTYSRIRKAVNRAIHDINKKTAKL